MAEPRTVSVPIRFGPFEVSPDSGELRKNATRLKLFGDFEHGLNAAVKRLCETLGDSANQPVYIETIPRRGYRFIATVDVGPQLPSPSVPSEVEVAVVEGTNSGVRSRVRRMIWLAAVLAPLLTGVLLIGTNVGGWRDRLLRQGPKPEIRALAVLPLVNLSGDPQQEYFADSMTDALISQVGQVGSLRVISRTSVMQYKGTQKPLPQIARELNVDALVEGSVLRSGDRVRVTAQLIGAVPERHLWARSYDRDLRDVLTLESEVARAITEELDAKVTPDVQARLSRTRMVTPEAHELFLKGVFSSDPKKALEYYEKAIQKDPNFAQPYVGSSWTYIGLGQLNQMGSNHAFPKAKDYVRKALELDDSLDEAHIALAESLTEGDWNWSDAEIEFKRAFEINPNSAAAHSGYAWHLMFVGRMEEAFAEAKRYQELSPRLTGPYTLLAYLHYFRDRDYDEALAQLRKAEEVNPNCCGYISSLIRGWVYREKGMYKEAFVEFQKVPPVWRLGHLGNAYARAGKKDEARKAVQELMEYTKQGLGTWEVALVYAGLGEKDQAFEWLERAYKAHDKGMCYLKIDPPLDPLRSDPRFQDLLRRMNFPSNQAPSTTPQ